jgi:hypothetical protein
MELEWIRRDKLAPSTANERPTTGVDGDPTKATPELGKMFIGWKIDDAVNQIHELLEQNKSFRRRSERFVSQILKRLVEAQGSLPRPRAHTDRTHNPEIGYA